MKSNSLSDFYELKSTGLSVRLIWIATEIDRTVGKINMNFNWNRPDSRASTLIYFRFRLLARVISQEAESWHKHDRNRRKVKIRLLPTESARHWKQINCIIGNCFTYVLSVIKIMLQYSSNAGCLLGSIIVSFFQLSKIMSLIKSIVNSIMSHTIYILSALIS